VVSIRFFVEIVKSQNKPRAPINMSEEGEHLDETELQNDDNEKLIDELLANDDNTGAGSGSSKLTAEIVGQHISLLARTGNGLSHAYTRLEIQGKSITNIDILENYTHLRYLV
jgi:hypothetical protein